ncbi:hypothetical protein LRS13_12415 [Svornostia abyssi]|uniref:Uncharacterized protein n=1 Tax=Svornostia abyssi TaxID=2898438 RepID=A0ABY5PA77_9ACTN|nr:hypothetical protein LRS13_12415 [Parviterribacteraceae bacterium J379]
MSERAASSGPARPTDDVTRALDAFFATESWNRDRLGFRFGPDAVTWVPPAHVVVVQPEGRRP